MISLLVVAMVEAQNFKFGKVSTEEVLEEKHALEAEANAAVLYRKVDTYYEYHSSAGFTLVTKVHERIKIYNKEGFDWATREVRTYQDNNTREKISGIKGITYNYNNGKITEEKLNNEGIFEEELNQYQRSYKFTMPAVTQGSVIEFEYDLRSPFVTSIDDILLQYTIPINHIETTVSIPEFLVFKKHYNPRSPITFKISESKRNFSTRGTTSEDYMQNIYSLSQENIPSLKEEAHIDHLSNYGAFIKWELAFTRFPNAPLENYSDTWEGVSKKIYSSGGYEAELSRTNFFQDDLDRILKGITPPELKTAKIFAFLKSKVKWNSFIGIHAWNGGRKAYKEGEGNVADINLLLTAMLRYAGLDANPVLVSTKDNGVPLFPTQKGFNYVIAGVQLAGQTVLLDATEPNAGFGELPTRARNWNGRLLINKETSDWVSLMPEKQSVNKTIISFQFDNEMNLKGKSVQVSDGLFAKSFRDNYKGLESDSYIQILEKDKGNIHISEVNTENYEVVGQQITQSYNFDLEDAMEMIGDKIYLKPLLFMTESENPFKADTRKYPVIFDYPAKEDRTANILVPEGFEVEFLPESSIVELNNGAGVFRYIATQNGNYLRVQSVLDMNNTVYTPEDYVSLKMFYGHLVEKHAEAIVLKKI